MAVHIGDTNQETVASGFMMLFLCVLAFCFILNHYLGHKLHVKYLSEAGAVMIVGIVLSGIVRAASGEESKVVLRGISPTIFFIGFLPPIIFNSGYTLRRKVFLYYFSPIVLFAVLGTFMSSIFVGLMLYAFAQGGASYSMSLAECLAFGSLISSTDPVSVLAVFEQLKVEPLMFYLVFGESVLNDAVALVLFNIFSKFVGAPFTVGSMFFAIFDFFVIFIGSMIMGFLFGCASALLFKHVDLRHSVFEVAVYMLLAYIPSLFSASIELSGIVTILFTGMFARHYAHPNLSVEGQQRASFLFVLLALMSETSVFLELGLSVFSGDVKNFKPLLIMWTFILILIGRVINIYPISWFVNKYTQIKIAPNIQHMLWFAGLRGAMAYACSKDFPDVFGNQPVAEATTMIIVLLTVFGFGTFTVAMLEKLKIPLGVPANDAVSLTKNQSKLLSLEEKYVVPFLTRSTEFSTSPRHRGHSGPRTSRADNDLEVSTGAGQFGADYISNDHIDDLFGFGSSREITADTAGANEGGQDGGATSSVPVSAREATAV